MACIFEASSVVDGTTCMKLSRRESLVGLACGAVASLCGFPAVAAEEPSETFFRVVRDELQKSGLKASEGIVVSDVVNTFTPARETYFVVASHPDLSGAAHVCVTPEELEVARQRGYSVEDVANERASNAIDVLNAFAANRKQLIEMIYESGFA